MKSRAWLATLTLVVALWIGVSIAYHIGAGGVRVGGATTSFDRGSDHVLYRDDALGITFQISTPAYFTIVRTRPVVVPFCWLCGAEESGGLIINAVAFRHGDWLYSRYPHAGMAAAMNVKTRELVRVVADAPEGHDGNPDLGKVPELAALGLTGGAGDAFGPAEIMKTAHEIRSLKESCLVFNAAFMFLVVLCLIWGGVATVLRRR